MVFFMMAAVAPQFVHAESHVTPGECGGFIPCGCDTHTYTQSSDASTTEVAATPDNVVNGPEQCQFSDLITLVQNVLDWLIIISVPIAGLMFAYAGWLYISAQGDTTKIQSAHKVFVNVGIGLALVIGAWVIVYTIATAVLDTRIIDSEFFFLSS